MPRALRSVPPDGMFSSQKLGWHVNLCFMLHALRENIKKTYTDLLKTPYVYALSTLLEQFSVVLFCQATQSDLAHISNGLCQGRFYQCLF